VSIETHFRLEFRTQETMKKFMKKMRSHPRGALKFRFFLLVAFFFYFSQWTISEEQYRIEIFLFTYLGRANGKA